MTSTMTSTSTDPVLALDTLHGVVIVDGGLGTLLQDRLDPDSPIAKAMWNASLILSHPEIIQDAHRQYLDAGAHIITTATYQLSDLSISRSVPPGESSPHTEVAMMVVAMRAAINARAAFFAQHALDHPDAPTPTRLIAISMGSLGAQLGGGREYTGIYPGWGPAEIEALWSGRLANVRRAAAEAGLSDYILALETVPTLEEASAIARALAHPDHLASNVWSIVSYVSGEPGVSSCGEPLAALFDVLRDIPHISAVGVNCSPISVALHPLLSPPSPPLSRPLFSCPNGMVWDVAGARWLEEAEPGNLLAASDGAYQGPDRWARCIVRQVCPCLAATATTPASRILLGGCCMTTPAHIASIVGELGKWSPPSL